MSIWKAIAAVGIFAAVQYLSSLVYDFVYNFNSPPSGE